MLRNLDDVSGKFLMYPRFIQTFLDKQLDGLPTHKEKYDVSFRTKKVFANINRIGKGFSGKGTHLFPTMMGPNQVQMGEGLAQPNDTQHTLTFDMPHPKPKKTQKPLEPKRKSVRFLSLLEDELKRTKSAQQTKIDGLERRVNKLEKKPGMEDVGEKEVVEVVTTTKMLVDTIVDATQVATAIADVSAAKLIVTTAPTITAKSKKTNVEITQAPTRKGVIIQEPEETTTKIASSQQSQVRDKGKGKVKMIEEPVKLKKKELFDKAIKRINNFIDFKTELVQVEDDKESEELKKCVEIILDDEDDILIDSTPLSSKSPTIIVYQIYKEGKKNYFQIFRADGNSHMYFGEDLEVLWRLDKDIFVKTKLVDGMDSFLLHTLKTMFEHHVKDNV
nr:hypothetical protein [Tanacetum cinerariifolium]